VQSGGEQQHIGPVTGVAAIENQVAVGGNRI